MESLLLREGRRLDGGVVVLPEEHRLTPLGRRGRKDHDGHARDDGAGGDDEQVGDECLGVLHLELLLLLAKGAVGVLTLEHREALEGERAHEGEGDGGGAEGAEEVGRGELVRLGRQLQGEEEDGDDEGREELQDGAGPDEGHEADHHELAEDLDELPHVKVGRVLGVQELERA